MAISIDGQIKEISSREHNFRFNFSALLSFSTHTCADGLSSTFFVRLNERQSIDSKLECACVWAPSFIGDFVVVFWNFVVAINYTDNDADGVYRFRFNFVFWLDFPLDLPFWQILRYFFCVNNSEKWRRKKYSGAKNRERRIRCDQLRRSFCVWQKQTNNFDFDVIKYFMKWENKNCFFIVHTLLVILRQQRWMSNRVEPTNLRFNSSKMFVAFPTSIKY